MHKTKNFPCWLIVVASAFVWITVAEQPARADDSFDIRPHWTVGQRYYIEFEWKNNIDYIGADLPEEARSRSWSTTDGWWQEVESISSNGTTRIVITLERLAASYGEDPSQNYDSDLDDRSGETSVMGAAYRELLGKSMTMEVDAEGKLVSLTGIKAHLDAAARKLRNNPYVSYLQEAQNDDHFQFLQEQLLAMYAFGPKKVGETWARRFAHDEFDFHWEFELESKENLNGRTGLAIAYESQSLADDDAAEGEDAKPAGKDPGEVTGQAFYDIERGLITFGVEFDRGEDVLDVVPQGQQSPVKIRAISKGEQTLRCMTVEERRQAAEANRKKGKAASRPAEQTG